MGKIATAIIAKLRNEKFNSIEGIKYAIRKALKEFNEVPFQKREGSRKIVFNAEERSYLRPLPNVTYEVSAWKYGCNVNPSSHVWFNKSQYSVPGKYVGEKVDLRYIRTDLFIYYNRELIAKHKLFSAQTKNGKLGPNVKEFVIYLIDTAKIQEQALQPINALFKLSGSNKADVLNTACRNAMAAYRHPTVNDVREQLKKIKSKVEQNKPQTHGIVRGADYYRKAGNIDEI